MIFASYIFISLMCILILLLPRRYALIPAFATASYMTLGNVIVIGGFHFYFVRIIVLFGWIRLILKKENKEFNFNVIDKAFLMWVASNAISYIMLRLDGSAINNRLGFAYDSLLWYFLFRCLFKNVEDIKTSINAIAIIIVPLAISMLFESQSGRNIFDSFSGIAMERIVRNGHIRCQGTFLHAILAGTFGATIVSLIFGQWLTNKNKRKIASIGIISATIITMTSASSGPLTVFLASICGFCMWFFKKYMRIARWGFLLILICLQMIMKAPVWFLIARVGEITGGSAYHRAVIIDLAIKHFNEWWMLGATYTAHWMPYTLTLYTDKADITNMFIAQGITGGLLTMILFIRIIVICFRTIGQSLQHYENKSAETNYQIWAMGVALFAHIVAFFSVSYFDQSIIYYFMLIALISCIRETMNKNKLDI